MASRQTSKTLLLTLDAFSTLYKPTSSITTQYLKIAEGFGIHGINKQDFTKSLKKAIAHESKSSPNYGKQTGSTPEQWWTNVVTNTFTPFIPSHQSLPPNLATRLIHHFSSKSAYTLYDDVLPLLRGIRKLQTQNDEARESRDGARYKQIYVGILSNSDDRVVSVLDSFGIRIGSRGRLDTEHRGGDGCLIDFATLSYNVGVEKPSCKIFEAAFKQAKTVAGVSDGYKGVDERLWRKVHVGDSLEKDAIAAKKCGWEGVYLDREEAEEDYTPEKSAMVGEGVEKVRGLMEVLEYVTK